MSTLENSASPLKPAFAITADLIPAEAAQPGCIPGPRPFGKVFNEPEAMEPTIPS